MSEGNSPETMSRPPVRTWPLLVILIIQALLFALSITPSISNLIRFVFMLAGPALGLLLFLVCRQQQQQAS